MVVKTTTAALILAALAANVAGAQQLRVLVFGDSQGDTGPTAQTLTDALNAHNVSNNVVNKAVGGTLACGWAQDPAAIAKAAKKAFPLHPAGPDLVWLTAGGNDLAQDAVYHSCLDGAHSDDDAAACTAAAVGRFLVCTRTLLSGLWAAYPNAKVGQYGYEAPCLEGGCVAAAAEFMGGSYCTSSRYTGGTPQNCILRLLQYVQTIFVDALQAETPTPKYTGFNLLGACQGASGVPGASAGHPNVTGGGSKCEWMTACVHPIYGTPAAQAIGAAFWDLWLEPIVAAREQPALPLAAAAAAAAGAEAQQWKSIDEKDCTDAACTKCVDNGSFDTNTCLETTSAGLYIKGNCSANGTSIVELTFNDAQCRHATGKYPNPAGTCIKNQGKAGYTLYTCATTPAPPPTPGACPKPYPGCVGNADATACEACPKCHWCASAFFCSNDPCV